MASRKNKSTTNKATTVAKETTPVKQKRKPRAKVVKPTSDPIVNTPAVVSAAPTVEELHELGLTTLVPEEIAEPTGVTEPPPIIEEPTPSIKSRVIAKLSNDSPAIVTNVAPALVEAKLEAPVSQEVASLRREIDRYLLAARAAQSATIVSTQNKALKLFINIMEIVCRSTEQATIDEFFKFFVRERKNMLAYSIVLRGVSAMEASRRSKISEFYTTFFALANYKVDKQPFRLDIEAIRIATSNTIASYVAAKANS